MLRFVIWGAGIRGRRLLNIIGDNAIAYIDKVANQKSTLAGLPIMNFEEYQAHCAGLPIIVSPYDGDEILAFLKDRPEVPYISLLDEPWFFSQGTLPSFDELNLGALSKEDRIHIYGIGLMGIMLFKFLKCNGYSDVSFIPGKRGVNEKQARKLGLQLADKIYTTDIILCTEKNIEEPSLTFPANRVEDFWNLSYYFDAYGHKELERFRNIHCHDGRRLFIVATGPSLRISDLDRLHEHGELTMSMNMVFRAFDKTRWRPDYYLMQDIEGMKEYEEELRRLDLPHVFLSDCGVERWKCKAFPSNIHVFHLNVDVKQKWPRVSGDIASYVFGGGTVVLSCLQVAFYMGIREIYLVGADCNYIGGAKDRKNHFISNYCKPGDGQPDKIFPVKEVFRGYQAVRYYAREHGIKIFNATRGGNLEVFERVDFDSLFNN
ncbi:MAG: DUF115 domain-containing protein [Schwartzia succinivorans]|nr:DUF115 domain-containing protein [Schwartzia succinivorans]